jgi:hypothetical protein
MEDLRKLLKQAYDERVELSNDIAVAEAEASIASKRFGSWERGFLLKRAFKQSFATRKKAHETAQAKCKELNEQLRLTTLATEIDVEPEQAESYYRMRDDFAALSECQKIWDTLERRAINRFVERSAAHEAITREPVSFSLNTCDLIQWKQKVPYLPNRAGGDMYIYPGFLLYRASKQAFALVDSREVTLTFSVSRFIEDKDVPSDARIVAHAWAKSNKDGSPDRRFRDNYQIPIALYGSLTFTSQRGLHEEYQLSNPALAERFAKAWILFQRSFAQTDSFHSAATNEQQSVDFSAQDRKVTTPADLATGFAQESATARSLALQRGESWEFLLTEELLRSKLIEVKKEYDEFETALRFTPKPRIDRAHYMNWLRTRMNEPQALMQHLTRCVEQELAAGLGKSGEEGHAIEILHAVNDIIECCRGFVRWELEICSAEAPENLKPLGATLRGFAGGIIADVARLPDEFARVVNEARHTKLKFQLDLTFSSPPQTARFLAELENVKKHPEWYRL